MNSGSTSLDMITVNDIIFLVSWPAAVVALFSLIDSPRTWVVRMGIVAIMIGLCGGALQVISGGRSQWPMACLSFGCLLYFAANWWWQHRRGEG